MLFVEIGQQSNFIGRGPPSQGHLEGPGNPALAVRTALAEDSLGESAGCFDIGGIVQHRQGLLRDVGPRSFGRTLFSARGIEGKHARLRKGSLPERVHASTILRFSDVSLPGSRWKVERVPVARRLVWLHARPSDFAHEQSRDRQSVITHHFGFKAKPPLMRQQAIVRISLGHLRLHLRGLPIRGRRDDQPDDTSHIPARVHEFHGQPIEKFRVGRPLALCAEVVQHFG